MKKIYSTPQSIVGNKRLRTNILAGSTEIMPSGNNTGVQAGNGTIPEGADAGAKRRMSLD